MRSLIHCLSALALCCCLQVAAADSAEWKGARVTDFLDSLNEQGMQVIYSSDVVAASLVLLEEPDFADLQASLLRILQPYGLGIEDGPGGSLLVVRAKTPAPVPVTPTARANVKTPLPEIIVSSSLYRLENVHTESHTYLDRELAARIPAAAEEAVRLTNRLPGTASGGISARNHVRGGEANEVLFLLDGLRLYEPFHLKDFQSIATIVNSNAVAGIDFYSGAYPARYGDRMSGVLNMSIREPVKDVETELALSFFNASVMSLGTFGNEEQGDWLIAARRGNLDLIVDVVDPDFGSPDYGDLLIHTGWNFGSRSDLSANFLYSNDKIRLTDIDRGEQADARYENEVVWVRWNADWNSTLRSETILAHTSIDNDRDGSVDLPGIVVGSIDDTRRFRVSGVRQDWTYAPPGEWMLRFGFDAKHMDGFYRFNSTKTVSEPFDSILDNESFEERMLNVETDGDQFAGYAELRWQPNDSVAIDVGLRRDQQSYTTAKNDAQTSPRFGLLYRFGESTDLRLGWGQFSQAQEVNELQISDGIDEYFPAQRAEHVVANLKHRFAAGIELDLSTYRKTFRKLRPRFENAFNALTVVPEIQFDRVRVDATSALSVGGELMLSKGSADESFLWWLGYAWAKVEDTTVNGKVRRSWDQTQTGKAGISWRWKAWNFSAAAEAHTGWPRTELIAQTVVNPDGSEQLAVSTTELSSGRYSVFHTLDARVSRDIDVRRGDLTLFLEVTNIYDRQNPCCVEYSLDAGSAGANSVRSREAHWLPIVPSLGVVWRF